MIMEKGMSSVEVLPSKSSQVTAVKVMVKEHETKSIQKGKRVGFVLVHAGAGYHSESKAKEYKHVCKRACQKAIEKLQAGALATDAVTAALIELEDSPFTNAGMGSNLNLLGEIECDASIMDGKSLNFGAVGALSGIKNPVSVANRLLCEGQKGKLSAGRIPPCFLVGEGAYRWAVDHGIPACSPGIMTTSCGEHLVRTILARECSRALQTEDAHQALLETMQNKFISSPFLASEDGVLGGVIVLRSCRCSAEPDSLQEKQTLLVEFLWSHTTESMCVGYMSAQDGKAKSTVIENSFLMVSAPGPVLGKCRLIPKTFVMGCQKFLILAHCKQWVLTAFVSLRLLK
ncbi:threonine aspartase 1 isoform X10 [Dermochelys coriacea]|uniref:threonine aspartase 1 isoform X10 n=1 Tax=Dermochelys coriacea TaxID=27794 RepID=UPI001CA9D8B2|nr:threonine aspartase 1 isoform X10 [Dermochelys coriacea]